MEKSRLLNWQEACKLLSCKRSHFYNLVNSGALAAVRLGEVKGLRVREEDCLKYLRSRAS
ncbi:MAG: helix-turn-helix domain-containing protein [Desulfovibrio sp.]|nr:helix-turn-helix domain-containing protein [Desulfovibrio sp.]